MTQFTIGGRTYTVNSLLKEQEAYVTGKEFEKRAKEIGAYLGEEDVRFILEHQSEIPTEMKEFYLVFPGWRDPDDPQDVAVVCWCDDRWVRSWDWLGRSFGALSRVLCRKSGTRELGNLGIDSPLGSFDPLKLEFSYGGKKYKVVEL